MIQFLVNILSPFFLSLGVSQTDINNYANQLSGYVYAILGTLCAAIVVMVAAHWVVKKGSRHVVRWSAALSWLMIVVILVNVIAFGPMYNNLAPIINGQASVSEESAARSKDVIQQVGEEGTILLKNNGTLPLEQDISKLNVFGWASTSPILGGMGSGSSDSTGSVDIINSLQAAGYETNQTLTDMYTNYASARGGMFADENGLQKTDWTLPEPTADYYTDEIMTEAKDFSDTALIVISRLGGEGRDEMMDVNAVINGTLDPRGEYGTSLYDYYDFTYTNNGDYDDFEEGEHYLELSRTEEDLVELVTSEFENVIVFINTNNVFELGWAEENDNVDAILYTPGAGATGLTALGEILNGTVNPSGKTVDTFMYDLFDTPTANNFGGFIYQNTEELVNANLEADPAYWGVQGFVNYVEGIYVGYKFYETAAEEGLINYEEKVLYPFGYGLSYTTFEQTIENVTEDEDTITLDVVTKNTGDTAGKTAVELYYTPPYTNGGIEKASVNLIDFGKTQILQPGESETITFTVAKEDMASYDATEIKVNGGGYILEAGEYELSVRADAHTVSDSTTFEVEEDILYNEESRDSDLIAATNQFEDYSAGDVEYLSRKDGFANYETATAAPDEDAYNMDEASLEKMTAKSVAFYDPTQYENEEDEMPTTGAKNGLKLSDMIGKTYDDPQWEDLLDQLTFDEMSDLVNLAGFQTIAVSSVDKKATLDSDGTAGLNDWYIQVYGTAYPVELMVAQTWNRDLAAEVGDAVGAEYADCGIYGWYGPAMNIHRSPFGGRNFEYFSEDGVLSGIFASAEVNAAAEHGVYAYIKHFVLNEQETNRVCMLMTYSGEQAIREIYMKPFETCVKNFTFDAGKALAVMSSFVFIGDTYCGANPNLLNTVLRDEWGFKGMVLTDWDGSYGYQNTDDCVRNGNDAMLGFNQHTSNVLTDTESATLTKALRQASKNIMYTVVNSGNYTNEDASTGMAPMTEMFVCIDVIAAILLLGVECIVLLRYRKKRKAVIEIEVQNAE